MRSGMTREDRILPDRGRTSSASLRYAACAIAATGITSAAAWSCTTCPSTIVAGLCCACPHVRALVIEGVPAQWRTCCGQHPADVETGAHIISQAAEETMPTTSSMVIHTAKIKFLRIFLILLHQCMAISPPAPGLFLRSRNPSGTIISEAAHRMKYMSRYASVCACCCIRL